MWSASANWNVATYMWFMCDVTCWLYKCWGVNIWIKLVVYFINKCYIVFPVGVCILPDGLAGRGELAIPVGLFFLSAIPDGFSGKIRSWLIKPHPTGITDRDCFLSAIRQEIVPFPDELFLSADSWWLAVGKSIPDSLLVIPDGLWPTGISPFLVVI